MLNNRGIYYAKLINKDIDKLKDELINENVIRSSDLNYKNSLADISKTVSTVFSGDHTAIAYLMNGYSEAIYKKFYSMGSANLEESELADAYIYFKELKTVYDSKKNSKSYDYFRKYMVRAMDAKACLNNALRKAELNDGIINKQSGSSYTFNANVKDIIPNFSIKGDDFTKVGLKLPETENEFVQLETNELFREKTSSNSTTTTAILNIVYNDDKEKNSKIYPVISTFDGKPFQINRMISATDLMDILMTYYNATCENVIFDTEPFYKKANDVWRQCLQPVEYLVVGKNRVMDISTLTLEGTWPTAVLNAKTTSDLTNFALLTPRGLEQAMNRRSERRSDRAMNN